MAKGSASRGANNARSRQAQARAAGPRVNTSALIHPMFQSKINELGLEQKKKDGVDCWTELNNMYVAAWKAVESPSVVGTLAHRKDIIAMITDHAEVKTRIDMLKRDINLLKTELSTIYEKHKDESGLEYDENKLMDAAMIGEQYAHFVNKVEAMLPPNVQAIVAIFTDAELRLKAKLDAQVATAGVVPADALVEQIVEIDGSVQSIAEKAAAQDARIAALDDPQQPA